MRQLGPTVPSSPLAVVAGPAVPSFPAPVQTPAPSAGLMGQYPTPVVQSNGSPSSTPSYPMLCSITPPWAGGYVGDVKTTPGWSEARPTGGLDNMTQPSHLYYGSTSRSPNQLLLSSCPQYGMGLPGDMYQSQPPHGPVPPPPSPPSPGGRPAYCLKTLSCISEP